MAGTVSHRPCSFLGDSRQKPFRSMLRSYHRLATPTGTTRSLSPSALAEVIDAILAQDDLSNQLGSTPHYHFDNNRIAESEAYVEDQQRSDAFSWPAGRIDATCPTPAPLGDSAMQFTRTPFCDLWLTMHGGTLGNYPSEIEPLEQAILADERLCSGTFYFGASHSTILPIWDLCCDESIALPIHATMHLDSPKRNPYFEYAFVRSNKHSTNISELLPHSPMSSYSDFRR